MPDIIHTIIVTFNGGNWIEQCLGSLRQSTYPAHTVVVDNGSTDATASIIRKSFPHVELIELKKNLGFGQANNIGIARAIAAGADYVFLLNQDAWVEKDTIAQLVAAQKENQEFGILSPVHLNGKGSGVDLYFLKYFLESDIKEFITSSIFRRGNEHTVVTTAFVNAAAWLITADCIRKTGGFDPVFFHYGEDRNYMQRAQFWGFKAGIHLLSKIYHDREERIGRTSDNWQLRLKKDWTNFLNVVCDVQQPNYLSVMIKRFFRCCLEMIAGLVTFNKARFLYNYHMAANIAGSFNRVVKSRRSSAAPNGMAYLKV